MHNKLLRICIIVLLTFSGVLACSETVRFAFSGSVNQVSDPNAVLNGSISLGMALEGTLEFDADTSNSGSSPDLGVYIQSVPLEFETHVGPYVARTAGPGETYRFEIGDNLPGIGDRYFAYGNASVTGNLPPVASALSRLTMTDVTGGALNSIALPMIPVPLNSFASRSVTLRIQTQDNRVAMIRSSLDSLVLSQPGGAIQGHIELDSFIGNVSAQAITVEVRHPGSETPIESRIVSLNSNGDYICPTSQNGFFDIAIKGSHFLRKTHAFVFISASGVDHVDGFLLNGDVDNDNEVTLVDFALISNGFGRALGDAGFSPNADLDGDDEVNLADIAILSNSFGLAGDP